MYILSKDNSYKKMCKKKLKKLKKEREEKKNI